MCTLYATTGARTWVTPRSNPFHKYNITFYKHSYDQLRHPGAKPSALLQASISLADPRLSDSGVLGRTLEDEYAVMREKYEAPKNPVVLCHGLLGFDELRLAGNLMPGIAYWRGIGEGLTALGAEVITTAVPALGSIEVRAKALMKQIEAKAAEKSVNLIGGIDSRYMIGQLKPDKFNVEERLPRLYKTMEKIGLETEAFSQLTTSYMQNTFNPVCPDVEGVSYYSYGAIAEPGLFSPFRQSHKIIWEREGPNDGLVSVQSAKHGIYKGTLIGPTHLDFINWTNRLKWMIMGRRFNAVALYCDIADMLAKEGL
ncbi:triacylglycerol lipase [Tirmania nivea]|nr:triacylglycerol lipase [Tirmania nivea]